MNDRTTELEITNALLQQLLDLSRNCQTQLRSLDRKTGSVELALGQVNTQLEQVKGRFCRLEDDMDSLRVRVNQLEISLTDQVSRLERRQQQVLGS